jgi:uncharacterized protein YdeI (YjbR/CyaY-like superfamily)
VKTFASAAAFRQWLKRHHRSEAELVARCYKTNAKEKGLTYLQALDEALCFGWIDGVRRGVDQDSFSVRFTPRRPKSRWSAVNIRKVGELEAAGRMQPAGHAAFAARAERPTRRYSYESKPTALDPAFERRLRGDRRAGAWYQSQPPWYRRITAFWVMEAKREETRERRFATLLACCRKGEPIGPLRRADKA